MNYSHHSKFSGQNGSSFRQQKNYDPKTMGASLIPVDWKSLHMPSFQKSFYKAEDDQRTSTEVAAFRKQKEIFVKSDHQHVPHPFMTWKEA